MKTQKSRPRTEGNSAGSGEPELRLSAAAAQNVDITSLTFSKAGRAPSDLGSALLENSCPAEAARIAQPLARDFRTGGRLVLAGQLARFLLFLLGFLFQVSLTLLKLIIRLCQWVILFKGCYFIAGLRGSSLRTRPAPDYAGRFTGGRL